MRKAILLGVLAILPPLVVSGAEQKTSPAGFDATFYSPIEITATATHHASTAALSNSDQKSLLAARSVLGQFFRGLSGSDPKSLNFLDPQLRSKYKTSMDLYRSEFNAEAILKIEIFDFNIQDNGRTIQFRYFLTDTTEGTVCEHQRAVTLQNSHDTWRISRFNQFDFRPR